MKFFATFIFCVLSIFIWQASAQPTAVITDLQHEVKLYANLRSVLGEESFPDYFAADTVWTATMLDKIKQFARQKTGVEIVSGKNKFHFLISNKGNITDIPFSRKDSLQPDYLVSVVTTTHLLTTAIDAAGMMVKSFNHTCMIDIIGKDDASVFSSRIISPFRTSVKPGIMHGVAELSLQDFQALYEKTLNMAFENKTKKLPVISFFRPPFESKTYSQFLKNAGYFIMQESVPEIPLQKGEARNSRLIIKSSNGKVHNTMEIVQRYAGNAYTSDGSFHTKATLKNDLLESVFEIWVSLNSGNGDSGDGFSYPSKQASIAIRCTEQGLIAGDFLLTSNRFEGKAGYEVYTINRITPKNTIELLVNSQVKGIVQKGGTSSDQGHWQNYYMYFSKELDPLDMGNLLNIYLMYKMAHEYGQDYIVYH